jgi:antitoxin MazE
MKTRIQKWGNSLALRIPKALAAGAQLEQDSLVELTLVDGRLTLFPIAQPALTLEELLAQVTDENRHREVDTGPAVGNEVW